MDRQTPRSDPRLFQIAILSSFLIYGSVVLDFEVRAEVALAIVMAALATQYACTRWFALGRFDARSALISGLSLSLLLRTDLLWLGLLAGLLAIGSKFLVRIRNKHVFNPANFALATLVMLTPHAWSSPGQWGGAAVISFLIAGLGLVVLNRVGSYDVTLSFLGAWVAICFGRAAWLGDPWEIPLHQLSSGALLVFAFFMISDPKTTPDARAGRCLYGALVAAVAATIQFGFYQSNGALFALFVCAPLVPVIDRLLPAARYQWQHRQSFSARQLAQKGVTP
jgi:Na+-transporting NADH:ubiquinone oxidoreductase subunit NqrB